MTVRPEIVSQSLASVVVNNYNYARFLGEAIESALAQTYANLEVVVVDDGSTDESRAVIASFGDRVVPVLKQNGGMASALNAGFRACRGDIVVFLDSDDTLAPTAVASAATALLDPCVAKVHWQLRKIDADGRETGHLVPTKEPPAGNVRDLLIAEGPMSCPGAPTSGNAWTRRFLENVMPMPEQALRQHADAYLNTLSGLYGEFRNVSAPQGCYRVHGGNDYASETMVERLRRNLQMYHYRSRLLSASLRASGVNVHPAAWKTDNSSHYRHLVRRFTTMQAIVALVPPRGTFILVDEGAFGDGRMIPDRQTVRFPFDNENPRGLPPDGQVAIKELERLRAEGAEFVVFVKPALHWLTSYEEMCRHLESNYVRELVTDVIVAFGLRP